MPIEHSPSATAETTLNYAHNIHTIVMVSTQSVQLNQHEYNLHENSLGIKFHSTDIRNDTT